MFEFVLIISAVLICQAMQAVDDFLSHSGVVSLAHGGLLGYGQVYVAKLLLEWGGANLGWLVVSFIAIGAVVVSAIPQLQAFHRTSLRTFLYIISSLKD